MSFYEKNGTIEESNSSSSLEHATRIDDLLPGDPKLGALHEITPLEKVFRIRSFEDNLNQQEEEIVNAHLNDRTVEQAVEIIQRALIEHSNDPAVPLAKMEYLEELSQGPQLRDEEDWAHEVKFQAFLIHDWSIYPEVRAATVPIDEEEPHDPETLRVYILGILFGMAGTCLDTFFFNRFPSISIGAGALQIFVAGLGNLFAKIPVKDIPIGFGKRLTINPGPWCFKEQMLTQLVMSVSVGSPYAIYAVTAQKNQYFYGFQDVTFGYVCMLVLSSQFMGFGISGLLRAFLVYPEQCVWYNVLPTITYVRSLSNNSEPRENINGWKFRRSELFGLMAVLMFIWYWVTNFLFQALSYFDWIAWIAPKNVRLQNMTGIINGIGINPWSTFDFNIASHGGMIAPFWATGTALVGGFISMFAIVIIWYNNISYTGHLPINSNSLYNNKGKRYKVANVLDAQGKLDQAKYEKYSLPFYSAGNLVSYGTFFMAYPAMIVFAILNYWDQLSLASRLFIANLRNPRSALDHHNDRFSRVQRQFKEVPEWWFMLVLLVSLAMAIALVEHYRFTQTPVWTIFFGIALATFFTIPLGILYSMTNYSLDVNVLFELIIGYALPGNGNALMVSKVYATNFLSQADNYITNQKQAHYTGIAPRTLFRSQMISVLCNCWVAIGLIWWQNDGGIHDMCSPTNPQKFTCQGSRTFFNAAVIWGTIGPKRVFNFVYPKIKYAFLIGTFLPIPFWFARRFVGPYIKNRSKNGGIWTYLHGISSVTGALLSNEIILLYGSIGHWAPYNLSYYIPNFYLALLFNYFLQRKYHSWWRKYNYVIFNGWVIGIAYSALIMFFATQYHHMVSIDWWGNNVPFNTGDAEGMPLLPVPDIGYFGPEPGTYP